MRKRKLLAFLLAMLFVVSTVASALTVAAASVTLNNVFVLANATQGDLDASGAFKSSSTAHKVSEYIAVKAGDVITLGPVDPESVADVTTPNVAFGYTSNSDATGTPLENLTITDSFGQSLIYTGIVPEGCTHIRVVARMKVNTKTPFQEIFTVTVNQPFDCDDFESYWKSVKGRSTYERYYGTPIEKAENSALTGKTALFAGDSITFASRDNGLYAGRGWGGRIGTKYGMTVVNVGKSGATTSPEGFSNNIPAQLETAAAASCASYDYVMLHGGTNDAIQGVSLGAVTAAGTTSFDNSTYAGALEELFQTAKQKWPTAKIGFIINFKTPAPTNADHAGAVNSAQYADVAREVCEKWDIPYLDMNGNTAIDTVMQNTLRPCWDDGLHPNARGYDFLYTYVERFMLEELAGVETSASSNSEVSYYKDSNFTPSYEWYTVNQSGSTYVPDKTEYVLNSAADFIGFRNLVNGKGSANYNGTTVSLSGKPQNFKGITVKLGVNIVLNEGNADTWTVTNEFGLYEWVPIGHSKAGHLTFAGTFDGDYHYISGVYSNAAWETNAEAPLSSGVSGNACATNYRDNGFFFHVTNATIKNFAIVNSAFINSAEKADKPTYQGNASVVTRLTNGSLIENVYSDANVSGKYTVGGLVGYINRNDLTGYTDTANMGSTVRNCIYAGRLTEVENDSTCNALIGAIENTANVIENCLFMGEFEALADATTTLPVANNPSTVKIYYINGTTGSQYTDSVTGTKVKKTITNTTTITSCMVVLDGVEERTSTFDGSAWGYAYGVDHMVPAKPWNLYRFLFPYEAPKATDASDTPVKLSTFDNGTLKATEDELYGWYVNFELTAKNSKLYKVAPNADGAYEISTPEELIGFARLSNGLAKVGSYTIPIQHFTDEKIVLTNNLVFNEGDADTWNPDNDDDLFKWAPISHQHTWGTSSAKRTFCGEFDGQGHYISGLYTNGTWESNTDNTKKSRNGGLFSNIYDAKVHDFAVVNTTFYNDSSLNTNTQGCAIIDKCQASKIYNIYTDINLYGECRVAGIVGYVRDKEANEAGVTTNSEIYNCVFAGTMNLQAASITTVNFGGIVGNIEPTGTEADIIRNCAALGTVNVLTCADTDFKSCGGIVGSTGYAITVANCISNMKINKGTLSDTYANQICAISGGTLATISNCVWSSANMPSGCTAQTGATKVTTSLKGYQTGFAGWTDDVNQMPVPTVIRNTFGYLYETIRLTYVQESNVGVIKHDNGDYQGYTVRFASEVYDLSAKYAGYRIRVNGQTIDLGELTTAYLAINAKGDDGRLTAISASYGRYFVAQELNIPVSMGKVTMVVTPYLRYENGTEVQGTSYTVVYDGGMYMGAVAEVVSDDAPEATVTENDLTYEYDPYSKSYVVTGYTGSATTLSVPATVNKLAVTAVGDRAFYGNTTLTAITLNTNITHVGNEAFKGCTNLDTIDGVSKVNTMGYSALEGTKWLSNRSSTYQVVFGDGVLVKYNGTGTTLTLGTQATIKYISDAFRGNTKLQKIVLPVTVKGVGEYAFANCTALTEVVFPTDMSYFGGSAFQGCTAMRYIHCTDGTTTESFTSTTNTINMTTVSTGGEYVSSNATTSVNVGAPQYPNVTLNGVHISQYVIVYDNDGALGELNAAIMLQSELRDATGYELLILPDTVAEQKHEILVGSTNRLASQQITSVASYLGGTATKLVLGGTTKAGLLTVATSFVNEHIRTEVAGTPVSLAITEAKTVAGDDSIITVLDWNVYHHDQNDDGGSIPSNPTNKDRNTWNTKASMEMVVNMVNETQPDVFITQETVDFWLIYLSKELGDTYALAYTRGSGWLSDETHNAIFYRSDKLNLIDNGMFWMSPTPNVYSSYGFTPAASGNGGTRDYDDKNGNGTRDKYDSDGNGTVDTWEPFKISTVRSSAWAKFEVKANGKRFMAVSCHLDTNTNSIKVQQAQVVLNFVNQNKDYPVILGGDFNVSNTTAGTPYYVMASDPRLADAGKVAWSSDLTDRRIDFVFVSKADMDVLTYRSYAKTYKAPTDGTGTQASDHPAQLIKLYIK